MSGARSGAHGQHRPLAHRRTWDRAVLLRCPGASIPRAPEPAVLFPGAGVPRQAHAGTGRCSCGAPVLRHRAHRNRRCFFPGPGCLDRHTPEPGGAPAVLRCFDTARTGTGGAFSRGRGASTGTRRNRAVLLRCSGASTPRAPEPAVLFSGARNAGPVRAPAGAPAPRWRPRRFPGNPDRRGTGYMRNAPDRSRGDVLNLQRKSPGTRRLRGGVAMPQAARSIS